MWKAYGNPHGAIALRTTVGRLRTAIQFGLAERCRATPPNNPILVLGRVKYIDYQTERIPSFTNAEYLHKRKSFDAEKEVRAIVVAIPYAAHNNGTHHFPGMTPSTFEFDSSKEVVPGLVLPVSLHDLIQSVYISPLAPDWIVEPVVKTLTCFGLSDAATRVKHSSLMRPPSYRK